MGTSTQLLLRENHPLLREREKEFQPFFSSLPIQQTNTKNVVVKGQGSRFQHNGGHPQEDAADEEGEGGVRRQSRAGRGEDDLDTTTENLSTANTNLESANKQVQESEGEVSALQRRCQLVEEDLERSEERLGIASEKLEEASKAADESERGRKVL